MYLTLFKKNNEVKEKIKEIEAESRKKKKSQCNVNKEKQIINDHLNKKRNRNKTTKSNDNKSINKDSVENSHYDIKDNKIISRESNKSHIATREEIIKVYNSFHEECNKANIINPNNGKKVHTLNTQFSRLLLDIFTFAKSENSKPCKMVDYIINNDKNYSINSKDKEIIDMIKKNIFTRMKNKCNDQKSTVMKSLYQYCR